MNDLEPLAREALTIMDRVLDQRSAEQEFEDVAKATRAIVAMRDRLIGRVRSGDASKETRGELDRVNQLLSMSSAAEYPLTGIHWERMEKTRDLLREMVAG